MSKVTNIKQQVKRSDRYAIFVDEKYSFSLGEQELINSGLSVGKEISKQELDKLKKTALLDKAYDRVLNLIAMRQRSEWEIRQYLKRKDSPEPLIEEILNKLSNAGFVNDLAFATAWVNNRRLLRPTSRRRLIQELKQKGVDEEVIKQVLEEDKTSDQDVLWELVAKKRAQSRYRDDLKLMQYLARQGFNYQDIKSTLQHRQS